MRRINRSFYALLGGIALVSSSIYLISFFGYAATPAEKAISPTKNQLTLEDKDSVADKRKADAFVGPVSLKAEYLEADSIISLSWEVNKTDRAIDGYEVERSKKGGDSWEKVGNPGSNSFEDFLFEPETAFNYRVRAFNTAEYSKYTNVIEIKSGMFQSNGELLAGEGLSNPAGNVLLSLSGKKAPQDIFVKFDKVKISNLLAKNQKAASDALKIRIKNSDGDEVFDFGAQATLVMKYSQAKSKGVDTDTLKIGLVSNDKIDFLRSKTDPKTATVTTSIDQPGTFVIAGTTSSPILLFLKIILWILVTLAVAFGGYYVWLYLEKKRYQKEHRDDYIYKH